MNIKNLNFIKFKFDKDRSSSLVLIINDNSEQNFTPNLFLKKQYAINYLNDEGETQTYTFSVTAPNIAGSNNLKSPILTCTPIVGGIILATLVKIEELTVLLSTSITSNLYGFNTLK